MRYRVAFALLLCTSCALPESETPPKASSTARALELPELSASERKEVNAERLVVKESVVFRDGRKYVGGLSFMLVHAPPAVVIRTIFSTEAALEWMPETLSAQTVESSEGYLLVRFEQGEKPFVATHTLHFWRDDLAIRWKLDPRQHHDIADAWGFLSATAYGDDRSLVTLGILIDLGDGVVRAFAEPDIQRTVLGTPETIKGYVEARYAPRDSLLQGTL